VLQLAIKLPTLSNIKDLLNTDIKSLGKNKAHKKKVSKFSKKRSISKKLISFDIGSQSIKVVVGEKNKDKLIVYKAFSIPILEGAMVDGRIINALEVSRVIKENIALNNIKINDGVCTTNSTSIINREIVVPKGEDDEMDTVVNFAIQQYLHINMDDYIVQHDILGEIANEGIDKYKALVITYPSIMAKEYLDLLKESNLKPYALDVVFNSVKKLYNSAAYINDEFMDKASTVAFIDMGSNNINVHIYKEEKLEFTRIIKSGGGELDVKIARKYDITLKEAEERKIKYADFINAYGSEEACDFNLFIKEEVQEWVEEIQRIIQFYKNKKVGNKIDRIYIYGGSSRVKGMDTYLKERLALSVETINSIDNIQVENGKAFEDLDIYVNALGAIIRL
jgi:type IV pilus assembly protein PilM